MENQMITGTRVDCLYRVSTDKQVDHNDKNQADIPMQRKACHAFCEKMGWEIVHEEQEEGVSGHKVRAENRDKLQIIKERPGYGEFDILPVLMFGRIGQIADKTPFTVGGAKNGGAPRRASSGLTTTPTNSPTTSGSGKRTVKAKKPPYVPKLPWGSLWRMEALRAASPPMAMTL